MTVGTKGQGLSNHKAAFALMWYACECGHRERAWNSRDGVAPFATTCPSCGKPTLFHVDWHLDRFAPGHKPNVGQMIFKDMTLERATELANKRIVRSIEAGYAPRNHQQLREDLIKDFLPHPDIERHRA